MLPRRLRLSRRAFPSPRVLKRAEGVYFSLSYGPCATGGAATIVSKAVAKRSVDRHLLKRRMLSVVRPFVRENMSLIVYARKGAPLLSFNQIERELSELLSRTIHS